MRQHLAFVVSLVLLALVLAAHPLGGAKLREAFVVGAPSAQEYNDLVRQNVALKSEAALFALSPDAVRSPKSAIYAFVYSRYPFNFKHELLVDAGRDRGVSQGDVALLPYASSSRSGGKIQGSFLGTVESVFEDTATVRTIFDARFERAVRIGNGGVDALISGGNEPRITLIPKRANVVNGDVVYTASPGVPYGLPLGTIRDITSPQDALFREAKLALGYDVNNVKVLQIVHAGTVK